MSTRPRLTSTSCFAEQLIDRANELAPGVDLVQFWPLQRASSVDARQSFYNLFSLFCSQRLGFLVARGNVNDGECILVRLSTSRQAVICGRNSRSAWWTSFDEHFGLSGDSAGTPSCYFRRVFCSLVLIVCVTESGAAGSVTLSTSSAICWFSIIVFCLRALISKLAVIHCC